MTTSPDYAALPALPATCARAETFFLISEIRKMQSGIRLKTPTNLHWKIQSFETSEFPSNDASVASL
jgi:hypothetical protein